MDFLNVYMNNIWQTPSDYYKDFDQAFMDSYWDDTTQIRTIKEQSYPFSDVYTEYECRVSTVTDFKTNTNKVDADYISVLFKDIDHPLNNRGQKYLYKPNGIDDNYYLCYDKLNPLSQTANFKCIRCNNYLTFLLEDGKIIKEPCFVGYEYTSIRNNVTKDATTPERRLVCLVQGNNNTSGIKINQRFILQHSQAFKITEMNVLNQENNNTEEVTMYTFYIEWSSILSAVDNLELNIADYYQSKYTVKINSSDLSLITGSTGQLTYETTLNGVIVTGVPVKWSTSDSNVITVDSGGNYHAIGLSGSTAVITCYIDSNTNINDSINVAVASSASTTKELIINPITIPRLTTGDVQLINYGIYINNVLQSDVVTITPSGASSTCYTLTYDTNSVYVTNVTKSMTPLILTFTSGLLSQQVSITLGGLI